MEFNKELLAKAKEAKTVEELKNLAKENGVELNDEQANAYFAQFCAKSGELQDEELDNVAGGGCHTDDGRLVVTALNYCEHWVCETHGVPGYNYNRRCNSVMCKYSSGQGVCSGCYYSVYEDALLLCNHPANKK